MSGQHSNSEYDGKMENFNLVPIPEVQIDLN